MTEQDILNLIQTDPWMMNVLYIARDLDLPDWMIGAGFVRNKVWDHLHGFNNVEVPTRDIDLIYFKPGGTEEDDKKISEKLKTQTGINWEVVNQAYTHTWHNREPYKNSIEALAEWVETPTCVAVSMDKEGALHLHAPHGIEDLVQLNVRPSPQNFDKEAYIERAQKKGWQKKWPKLKILS